ncbi:10717_t:CDS:2, partial [Racocetra persica]
GDALLEILQLLNHIEHPLELRELLPPKSKVRQIAFGKRKGQWKFNLDSQFRKLANSMTSNNITMNNTQFYQLNDKREIKFTHPGIILNKKILKERRISQKKLATETNIPLPLIKEICQGKRDIDQNQKEDDLFEVVEAKELEKNKCCQITLRVGYRELKEIFPSH